MPKRPVMLIILDGWGVRTMQHGNAVVQAHTPHYDRWNADYERSLLAASEEAVGLVPDQMGNSEVGHLNLGAGRVVYQDISRIDNAFRGGSMATQPALVQAFAHAKAHKGTLHILGLVSDGGVHSHVRHLNRLLGLAAAQGVQPVLHVITDGRDTPPDSAAGFVADLDALVTTGGAGVIATVSGRYTAMDRDKRWERTAEAYRAIALRESQHHAPTAAAAVQMAYASGVTDEFIPPTVIDVAGVDSDALRVKPGDVLLFTNFRADRMRQIVGAFAYPQVAGLDVPHIPAVQIVTFTQYEDDLPAQVLFPRETLTMTLAETLARAGKRQYHSAETEKHPHVTYFFNGRNETAHDGETWRVIPSPKVATYDLQPEMSAHELTEATLERLREADDDFLLVNYANPDMVGHSGVLAAAVRAVETVDGCAGQLVEAVLAKGGSAIITADHGNCERMVDEVTGTPHTYHTTSLVPLFVIDDQYRFLRPHGILADVAPTVLHLLGVAQPAEMTGRTLIAESGPAE